MSRALLEILIPVVIVGSGVVGGVFFAFSSFVMKALARMPAAEGIRAMQRINLTVLNAGFLGAFMGTAAAAAGVSVAAMLCRTGVEAALAVTAGALYLVGTFGVTIAFNVPRNEALARLDPEHPASANDWSDYLRTWTSWNHVRTAAALAAMALLLADASS